MANPVVVPSADAIRSAASQIIQRSDYNLNPGDTALFRRMIDFIQRVFTALSNVFQALYDVSPVLAWMTIAILFIILIALIFHIVYSIQSALAGNRQEHTIAAGIQQELADPKIWERKAREAAAAQDYIAAVRHLFVASLLTLELAQKRNIRRGSTNREYLRRFQNTPAHEPLSLIANIIDFKWYGGGNCGAEDFKQATDAYTRVQTLARGLPHA